MGGEEKRHDSAVDFMKIDPIAKRLGVLVVYGQGFAGLWEHNSSSYTYYRPDYIPSCNFSCPANDIRIE